ncbi:MAG: response regulator [Azoarcus sp.]|jgi:diguanylate cyclase (GGDEF)-like protein|nr:response regulator [Azoarcus sp.]
MTEEETTVNENSPKILIVDDSRMVRASVAKQIRHRFRIREEVDGEAGWEALLIDPDIELVLTDLGMPRLDGFGLLERIRTSKVQRIHELPVVIISGDEDDVARNHALELGANDFVSKGAGCAEMTARFESLLKFATVRRSLVMSRNALESHNFSHPGAEIETPTLLDHHDEQYPAPSPRRQLAISVMVVEIDHYDQLVEWHGSHVAELITHKLAKILANKVRREDTITQLSGARFAVLSPSTDLAGCCAFGIRLQKALDKLVMTYRDERIRITVTIGVAGSESDKAQSVEQLIESASERVKRGIAEGGNRIVSEGGDIDEAAVEHIAEHAISLDQALLQLRVGASEEVMDRLPDVIATAMPLFELLEDRLHFGIPLGELQNYSRK